MGAMGGAALVFGSLQIEKVHLEWTDFEWGALGWVTRPANVPEATAFCCLDVRLDPGECPAKSGSDACIRCLWDADRHARRG